MGSLRPWHVILGLLLAWAVWPWVRDATAPHTATASSLVCPAVPVHSTNGPVQTDLPDPVPGPFPLDQGTAAPLAGYSVVARVLSREDYAHDPGSQWSPTDLVLGWGLMADERLTDQLNVTQGGRWYAYHWDHAPPADPKAIARHSANTHLVPADPGVARTLRAVRPGNWVRLEGWLVDLQDSRPGGGHWRSSLTRDDTGNGACELLYVCSIEILQDGPAGAP